MKYYLDSRGVSRKHSKKLSLSVFTLWMLTAASKASKYVLRCFLCISQVLVFLKLKNFLLNVWFWMFGRNILFLPSSLIAWFSGFRACDPRVVLELEFLRISRHSVTGTKLVTWYKYRSLIEQFTVAINKSPNQKIRWHSTIHFRYSSHMYQLAISQTSWSLVMG